MLTEGFNRSKNMLCFYAYMWFHRPGQIWQIVTQPGPLTGVVIHQQAPVVLESYYKTFFYFPILIRTDRL